MKNYSDPYLNSLKQAYQDNPDDLNYKKFFALELYKKSEFEDAYPLLKEIYEIDKDINVEKALNDVKSRLQDTEHKIGFDVDYGNTEDVSPLAHQKVKKKNTITFVDVAGMEHVKEAIRTDIIYPFQHPDIYKQYNKKAGGGILLFGPPGCGKTYIAKATAGEINAQFFSISIHELISSFIGTGERALHDAFESARNNTPSVLFFDEIDAIGASRSKTAGVLRTLVNQFLTELDGIESENEDVLTIGATNLPWEVDPALRRPGRFDKVIFVSPPDRKARERIFDLSLSGKPQEPLDLVKLADLTRQYSSADITKVCDEAAEATFRNAIRSGTIEKITQALLEEKLKTVKSTIMEWFATAKNYIQYSNESGLFTSVKEYLDNLKND